MTELSNVEYLKQLIDEWRGKQSTEMKRKGNHYYYGLHDILLPPNYENPELGGKFRYSTVDGKVVPMTNVVNTRIVDNMYAQMVDQKVNYLFSKPLLVETKKSTSEWNDVTKTVDPVQENLSKFLGRSFLSTLKKLATNFINEGIAYLYPYYNKMGEFKLAIFPGHEVIPIWADESKKDLDAAIRIYISNEYVDSKFQEVTYIKLYERKSIKTYRLDKIISETRGFITRNSETEVINFLYERPYVMSNIPGKFFDWGKIPLIPFRANSDEIPLIQRCKTIQDQLNMLISVYQDALLETQDTSLLAVSGAGGEDPGELRRNICNSRLIYLQNTDAVSSDVKAIQLKVEKDNYELLMKSLRRSIVENCRGFEIKDERSLGGGHLNEMNIKSLYVNLDLDANNIETEFQSSMLQLLYFLNVHYQNHGMPTFNPEEVTITTDRDTIVNLESQIQMAVSLYGKVSLKTFLSMLSVVDNVDAEYDRIMKEGTYTMKNNLDGENNETSNNSNTTDIDSDI